MNKVKLAEIKLAEIIRQLIEQDEKILKIRGTRGYGVGHPVYKSEKVSMNLGPQEEKEEVQQEKIPVKISNAFKNKKRKSNA